jgi:threonine synthase
MALSILPHLLQIALKKLNLNKEMVILTATSGDTGKAALEGFANVPGTKIIVFFPQEGVSEIQKRQMLTQKGENTHVIGISGNFDDAQRGVKEIFENQIFKDKVKKRNMILSSANSINIGRLVPQIVYYFYAYLKILKENDIKAGEKINIVVPTGNFGNILAAYYAREMGLPVNKLICASNDNRVLTDFFKSGIYDRRRELIMTISPSMDILISSNLERLLLIACHGKAGQVNKILNDLSEKGFYKISPDMKKEFNGFYGECASQKEAVQSIREVFERSEYLMDPHTAVGHAVYKKYLSETKDRTKTVIVATASPFKFTKSVMGAIDEKYKKFDDFELIEKMADLLQNSIPMGIKDIKKKSILHKAVCNKGKMKEKLAEILF